MRFRTTLILLVLALGLGAYVYFVEYEKATQEAKKKTLFEFKADDVSEVTLTYADRAIALHKGDDGWRLTQPIDAAADESAAKNLVNAIAECEVKKEVENAQGDLAVYGLDKPFVTVKVKLKDSELPAVLVGKNAPVGFSTYVSRDDDKKIRLATSAFRSGMDKQVKDLRDKAILTFADDDVRQIVLKGDGKDIALTKKDDQWKLERPVDRAADPAAIRTLLNSLRSMRAVDFPSENATDLGEYGLDAPRLTVTLQLVKGDEQKTLLFGKETDKKEVYAKAASRPTVYTVSDWVFRDLSKEPKDFRDKTVLAFDKDAAKSVEIKRADGSAVKLMRGDDQTWRIDGAADAKISQTAITQYVMDVHDLKGYDIAADKVTNRHDFGLDPPVLTLVVSGANDAKLGSILVGRRQPEANRTEYTVMADGSDTVFLVRDYLFTRLDKQQKDFLEQPTPSPAAAPAVQGGAREEDDEDEAQPEEPLGDD